MHFSDDYYVLLTQNVSCINYCCTPLDCEFVIILNKYAFIKEIFLNVLNSQGNADVLLIHAKSSKLFGYCYIDTCYQLQ